MISSQTRWPLDQRGGQVNNNTREKLSQMKITVTTRVANYQASQTLQYNFTAEHYQKGVAVLIYATKERPCASDPVGSLYQLIHWMRRGRSPFKYYAPPMNRWRNRHVWVSVCRGLFYIKKKCTEIISCTQWQLSHYPLNQSSSTLPSLSKTCFRSCILVLLYLLDMCF